jgi:hypothetical protein
MTDFMPLIEKAGAHLGRVIQMMVDGVAFPQAEDRREYHVFSHEGDELGKIATADVNYAIAFMKKQGRRVGKCHTHQSDLPAFTFGWEDWLRWDDCKVI